MECRSFPFPEQGLAAQGRPDASELFFAPPLQKRYAVMVIPLNSQGRFRKPAIRKLPKRSAAYFHHNSHRPFQYRRAMTDQRASPFLLAASQIKFVGLDLEIPLAAV